MIICMIPAHLSIRLQTQESGCLFAAAAAALVFLFLFFFLFQKMMLSHSGFRPERPVPTPVFWRISYIRFPEERMLNSEIHLNL